MFKKLMFISALLFGSVVFAAEPPPTPTLVPITDPVVAVIDNKLVLVQDVLSPKVNIVGAESAVGLGELVFLQAKLSDDLPSFVKNKSYKWTIPDKGFHEDGVGGVFFGAGIKNTKIPVKVDVAETYQIGDQLIIKTSSQSIQVQIGDNTPNPLPDPDPSPVPPKPPTPDLTGTSKDIFDMVQSTFGKNLSPDDTKKAAAMIAGDFDTCIKNIQSGKYDSFGAFSTDLKTLNQQGVSLLKLDLAKFDTFRTALNNWFYSYYQVHGVKSNEMAPNGDGTLVSLTDWVGVLTDISTGLKAVAK